MSLQGKRALVTGASRGIGAAIAKALAAEGADVAITYEKSAEAAGEVVDAIKVAGRRGVAIQADSADVSAVQASVEKTVAELGGLDILVNNAGILRLSTVKDISLEDIDALLNVNVRAPIVASKAAIPHQLETACGSCPVWSATTCRLSFTGLIDREKPTYEDSSVFTFRRRRNQVSRFHHMRTDELTGLLSSILSTNHQPLKWAAYSFPRVSAIEISHVYGL